MRVITIATDLDHPFLRRLLTPSCDAAGLRLDVLKGNQKGFRPRDKRALLTEYLAEQVHTGRAGDVHRRVRHALPAGGGLHPHHVRRASRSVGSARAEPLAAGNVGLALHDGLPLCGRTPISTAVASSGPPVTSRPSNAQYPTPPSQHFPLLGRLGDARRRHGTGCTEPVTSTTGRSSNSCEPDTVGLDHGAVLFENFAPTVANFCELSRWTSDFRAHGRQAASYRRERTRLESRLQSPSGAAQVHFASALAKTVLDLLDEGQLPSWLTEVLPR